jgi:hypothetical protein
MTTSAKLLRVLAWAASDGQSSPLPHGNSLRSAATLGYLEETGPREEPPHGDRWVRGPLVAERGRSTSAVSRLPKARARYYRLTADGSTLLAQSESSP